MTRTIEQVVKSLPERKMPVLEAPLYKENKNTNGRLALAVESMKRHMSDDGWQTFAGLEAAGYTLAGKDLPVNETDVARLLSNDYCPSPCQCCGARTLWEQPGVVALMDKREWEGHTENRPNAEGMRFRNVESLKDRLDIFKLTVLKDAHHNNVYHRQSAEEIGCHAWITYYAPEIVCCVAPFVRRQHLIRVYHAIDTTLIPPYSSHDRNGCLISGATNQTYYPLRHLLTNKQHYLPQVTSLKHPGYRAQGCISPQFMQALTRFKVAICTSSIFGYSLRKLFEATACGCVVLTNLPVDDVIPGIDGNLLRLPTPCSIGDVKGFLKDVYAHYNPDLQAHYAAEAKRLYDFRAVGSRLATDIEAMRLAYTSTGGDCSHR